MKTIPIGLRVWSVLCLWLFGVASAQAATVAAGSSHVAVVTPDGSVWTWGFNGNAQLGDGTTTNRAVPTRLSGLSDITAVASGTNHTLALKSDGTVWAWGTNSSGQVGDGTTVRRTSPVLLSLTSIIAIAAGESHSIALQSDGTVWVWGLNSYGQLGNGTTTGSNVPVALSGLTGTTSIAAGANHTIIVKSDGTAWAWGRNTSGQVGNGTTTNQSLPVQMTGVTGAVSAAGGESHSIVLLTDGTVRATGYNGFGQLGDATGTQRTTVVTVSGLSGVTQVVANYQSSGARRADGTLALWGANGNGQLGDGTTTSRSTYVVAIGPPSTMALVSIGSSFSIGVTADGVVWTWGANSYGQLGNGTTISQLLPAAISGPNYDWFVGTPALSHATGISYAPFSVTVTQATPGADMRYTLTGDDPTETDTTIASGGTILIDRSQTLKVRAWKTGMPASRIALANYTLKATQPVFAPTPATFTAPVSVTLTTTTPGATIRYTTDGSTPTDLSPAYAGPLSIATTTMLRGAAFKTGWESSTVYGGTYRMQFGTLSAPSPSPAAGTYTSSVTVTLSAMPGATIRYTTDNSTPSATTSPIYTAPIDLAVTTTIKAIAVHADYTTSAMVTATYTVQSATPTFTPTAGTYPAGQLVTVATTTPGATITYTLNGAEPTNADPTIVSGGALVAGTFTLKARAWKNGTTPSATATAAYVTTGSLTSASIAAGSSHSLAFRPDGTVWAWGDNSYGLLGDGAGGTMRTLPVPMAGVTGATTGDGGSSHTAIVRLNGQALALGSNSSGQLGDDTLTNRSLPTPISTASAIVAISAASTHTLALVNDGTVLAWGGNSYQQLGDGSTTTRRAPAPVAGLAGVSAVAAGESFSVALKTDGTVWTWGNNADGQLGDGTTTLRGVPTQVTLAATIVAIGAGNRHVLALANDGTIWGWGYNQTGQLGDGTTASPRKSPVQVSGLPSMQAIAVGGWHSLGIATDGSVYAWGSGSSGELGVGSSSSSTVPLVVTTLSSIVGVAAGSSFSLALASDGTVWSWGSNTRGQLGDGTTTQRSTPAAISGPGMAWLPPTPVIALPSGRYEADQQATVTCVDPLATVHYTTNGQVPTASDPVVANGAAVAIGQSLTLTVRAFRAGAPPSATASATYELKVVLPTLTPGSGAYGTPQSVTVATTTSGVTFTYTTDGTEPSATSTPYSAPIAVARAQTVKARAFKTGWTPSDSAYASYWLSEGSMAAPTAAPAAGTYQDEVLVTLSAASGATIRYTLDGSDPSVASPIFTVPLLLRDSATVKARAYRAGYAPSIVITSAYQLDAPNTAGTPTISPTGGRYPVAQTVTINGPVGAVLRYTTTGADPTASDPTIASGATLSVSRSLVLKVRAFAAGMSDSRVRREDYTLTGALSANNGHAIALKADGTVWTWGSIQYGGLGDGQTLRRTPAQVATAVRDVAAGHEHFLLLKSDGTVWGWGANSDGRLGDGTQTIRTAPVRATGLTSITAIAAGGSHSLALKADGTVWAWGENASGQLGDGTTTRRLTPTQVLGLSGVLAIGAGHEYSLALVSDGAGGGTVWAWGKNDRGQLGDGASAAPRLVPVRAVGLANVAAISAGRDWALARTTDGALWGWGDNGFGQIGAIAPASIDRPREVLPRIDPAALATMSWHALAIDLSGRIWGWGRNTYSPLGTSVAFVDANPNPLPLQFTGEYQLLTGETNATIVSRSNGSVWAVGLNSSGQLGDGGTANTQTLVSVSGLALVDNSWLATDVDQDGLSAWQEVLRGTDPLNADSNGDGVMDGLDALRGGHDPDVDGDGLSNAKEQRLGTNPFLADSDGDGVADGLDAFPLDPARTTPPTPTPGDTTPPTITLTEPPSARPVP